MRALLADAQHRQRRDDGDEDAREEDRHLPDRRPGVLVRLADRGATSSTTTPPAWPGGRRRAARFPRSLVHAEDVDLGPGPDARDDHALRAPRRGRAGCARPRSGAARAALGAPRADVAASRAASSTRSTQRGRRRGPLRATKSISCQSPKRPEERHAVQEAEEERRIAERRQRAADVRDQEDEEDERVGAVAARAVGPQQRADSDHRGAGRSDPRREDDPDGDDGARSPRACRAASRGRRCRRRS